MHITIFTASLQAYLARVTDLVIMTKKLGYQDSKPPRQNIYPHPQIANSYSLHIYNDYKIVQKALTINYDSS